MLYLSHAQENFMFILQTFLQLFMRLLVTVIMYIKLSRQSPIKLVIHLQRAVVVFLLLSEMSRH